MNALHATVTRLTTTLSTRAHGAREQASHQEKTDMNPLRRLAARQLAPATLVLVAIVFAMTPFLNPSAAEAQFGTCTPGNTCSIETRLTYNPSNPSAPTLCNDGIDNDGNGYMDSQEPHCQSEVMCQDGVDNDADGQIDGNDTDCWCVAAAATAAGGTGFNGNACTANDITVSYTGTPVVGDGCINPSDNSLVLQLFARVTTNPERWDLGMWLNLDGTDALRGSLCTRQALMPIAGAGPGVPATPDPLNPSGKGPFNNIDLDRCGDSLANSTAIYAFPFATRIVCTDKADTSGSSSVNGFLDLGQCGSWVQPASSNPVCNKPGDAVPGTSSKCNCARGETAIPVPRFNSQCDAFANNYTINGNGNGVLDVGETISYSVPYTNAVTGCTPPTTNPNPGTDPFFRNRCGTVSFLRMVVNYPSNANTLGQFLYFDGTADVAIPPCTSTATLPGNGDLVCNDTTNKRLVFAPRDTTQAGTVYGVVPPFTGTRSFPFKYILSQPIPPPATFALQSTLYWDNALDGIISGNPANGVISPQEAVTFTSNSIPQAACDGCTCDNSVSVTPITLAAFRATPEGRGVRFDWSTETEVGNVGFNVYAWVDGEKVQLNGDPIPTRGSNSMEPQHYSASFAVPDGATQFFVEDIDLRGRAKSHGPFRVDRQYGSTVETEPIEWSTVRRENGLPATGNGRGGDHGRGRLMKEMSATASAPSSSGAPAAIELHVNRTGLYRVTYEQLLAAGFDLASTSVSQLGLSASGQPVPMWVSTTGKFGPGSYIEFWGDALDTLYTDTNVYRLETGAKKPARAQTSSSAASGAAAASYPESRRFERNRAYAVWSSARDPFYDSEFLVFSSPGQWPFDFTIDDYVASGAAAQLQVDVYGGTSVPSVAPDHRMQYLINGTWVGESSFDGTAGDSFRGAIPAGALADGANTLTVRLPADTGAPYDLSLLDGYTVTYPRAFRAQSGALRFTGTAGRYDVTNLPDSEVIAYRRDGSTLTKLTAVAVSADGGGFRATVPGSAAAASYAVASRSGLLAPAAIQAARPPVDITTGPASYLVISHSAFLSGLDALVAARTADGFSVKVVDVEDVFAQFRGGVFDANAIRDYIAYAYRSMGTRYVLLVGADTYDYRNYLGLSPVSFVPSLYRATGAIVGFAPSDPALADVDGDGLQDLAIGRFPVRTPDELAAAVAKTLQYATVGSFKTAVFASDYADPGANQSFRAASAGLASQLPGSWQIDRIDLDDPGVTLDFARARLFADVAAGASLTQYTGHSGMTSWGSSLRPTSQHLFTINDVDSLTNSGLPTIVSQFGCWNIYWVSPRTESLGSRLLRANDKGAAAVLGAATLTEDANGNRFGTFLVPLLATPGQTIGEAIRLAKVDFRNVAPKSLDIRDILLGWSLLGDPALRIAP